MRRPATLKPCHRIAYDWLARNGVDEWLPENPTITIEDGSLTYTSYRWSGPRGWDVENIERTDDKAGLMAEDRTVPLVVPPDDRTIAAMRARGATVHIRRSGGR